MHSGTRWIAFPQTSSVKTRLCRQSPVTVRWSYCMGRDAICITAAMRCGSLGSSQNGASPAEGLLSLATTSRLRQILDPGAVLTRAVHPAIHDCPNQPQRQIECAFLGQSGAAQAFPCEVDLERDDVRVAEVRAYRMVPSRTGSGELIENGIGPGLPGESPPIACLISIARPECVMVSGLSGWLTVKGAGRFHDLALRSRCQFVPARA
jgi:hypothetical protein